MCEIIMTVCGKIYNFNRNKLNIPSIPLLSERNELDLIKCGIILTKCKNVKM